MKIFSPLPHDFQLEQDIPSSAPFVLSVHSVFMKLSLLNPTKAQGPDGLPAWLLKENSDLNAEPIAEIINSSFRESRLPPSWKRSGYSSSTETKNCKRRQQTFKTNFPHANTF
jgi:hypothetical protein